MFRSVMKHSKAVRNRYAFLVALSVTAVVAFIWVGTIPYRMSGMMDAVTETSKRVPDTNSFFGSMREGVGAAEAFRAVGVNTDVSNATTEHLYTPISSETVMGENIPRRDRARIEAILKTGSEHTSITDKHRSVRVVPIRNSTSSNGTTTWVR